MPEYAKTKKIEAIQFTGGNFNEIINFINSKSRRYSLIIETLANGENVAAIAYPSCNGHCLPLTGSYLLTHNEWIVIDAPGNLDYIKNEDFDFEILF